MPTHNNPTSPRRTACAPYNFVRLPDRVVRAVESADDLPDHDTFSPAGYPHCGYIDIRLKTESSIYIRGPMNRREWRLDQERKYIKNDDPDKPQTIDFNEPEYKRLAKNKPDFFYVDPKTKEPVIPGTSLRGMLLTLLEIVTYSKFTRFSDRQIVYRAVGNPSSLGVSYRNKMLGTNQANGRGQMWFEYPHQNVRGGFLVKKENGWFIQPAKEPSHSNESFVHVKQDDVSAAGIRIGNRQTRNVYVQPAHRTDNHPRSRDNLQLNLALTPAIRPAAGNCPNGFQPGWLIRTAGIGQAKHMDCVVYEPNTNAKLIPIPNALMKLYRDDCDLPGRGSRKTRNLLEEHNNRGNNPVPLFYLVGTSNEGEKLIYFGSTMMFRLPYGRGIKDCVPEELQDATVIDYADAMFGYVRDKKDVAGRQGDKARAYASRIRIGPAELDSEQNDWKLSANPITPNILASPKPTCFQHYLVQENPDNRDELTHYDSPERDQRGRLRGTEPRLRGTKHFWHQGNPGINAISSGFDGPISTQDTRMLPIRSGLTFHSRISFTNLSDRELGALLWILEPRGPKKNGQAREYCHKIGMDKPGGQGSVKLAIDKCVMINRKKRYKTLFNNDGGWNLGEEQASPKKMVEKMAEWKATFEREMLQSLSLDNVSDLYKVERIAELLQMLEWPGLNRSEPQSGVPVDHQNRNRNARYMTITPVNEYKEHPVLPDPSAFFDAAMQTLFPNPPAEPARPAAAAAPPPQGFQFSRGNTILVRRIEDKEKRGKKKKQFTSVADNLPARFLKTEDAPQGDVGKEVRAIVERTEASPKGYVLSRAVEDEANTN